MGTGLTGNYYNYSNLSNFNFATSNPVFSKIDTTVDFNWASGSPSSSVTVDKFAARWVGKVKTSQAGSYNFYIASDDGVRLYINGQLVINQWVYKAPTEVSGSISLAANTLYDIILEYFEGSGNASCIMKWSGPNLAKQIIPKTNLYPDTANQPVTYQPISSPQFMRTASSLEGNVRIFPSPSSGLLSVSITNSDLGSGLIVVTDLQGRILKNISFIKDTNLFSRIIDLSDLKSGVYFIRIKQNRKILTQKIVITGRSM